MRTSNPEYRQNYFRVFKRVITTKYITDFIKELRYIDRNSGSTTITYDSKFRADEYVLETDISFEEINNLFWLDTIEEDKSGTN